MSTVIYEKKGRIAYLTLNRPEVLNTINGELMQELAAALIDYRDDSEVWVAIITGAGERAFCAGADLGTSRTQSTAEFSPPPPGTAIPSIFHGTLEIFKPLIAAINGYAVGGGLELALCCDIRIAAEHARLGLVEPRRGLFPTGGGVTRITRTLPIGLAMELLLTADMFDASTALNWGLVNQVVPLSELMSAAEKMAERILLAAPISVRKVKETALKGLEMPMALALRTDFGPDFRGTEDMQEGIKSFMEKRTPSWKNR